MSDEATRAPAFLFDLDGTLIDSVYQHVLAWRAALQSVGINLSVWKIHRRIGMSGGLFVTALLRELKSEIDRETLARLPVLHADAYVRQFDSVQPLPGAAELLATLTEHRVPWAIATSGSERYARLGLELLGQPADTPMITRDQVRYAKPDPDLFLAAAERIGVNIEDAIVVGDSVWDVLAARRARSLAIGLLSGGYGREELIYSGAFRVYEDPHDLLAHLDEVGVRRPLWDLEDRITPNGTAEAAFTDDSGAPDALSYAGAYKLVFLAFPLEAYGADADKADLVNRVFAFFGS